jgi:hypothetical protein
VPRVVDEAALVVDGDARREDAEEDLRASVAPIAYLEVQSVNM